MPGGSLAPINYPIPIESSTSTGTVPSNFPPLLGDSATSGTLIGDGISQIDTTRSAVSSFETDMTTRDTEIQNILPAVRDLYTSELPSKRSPILSLN